MPIVEMLREFADRKNATPAQISLAWMLHKYPNVVPIPGSKNKERIIEDLNAAAGGHGKCMKSADAIRVILCFIHIAH